MNARRLRAALHQAVDLVIDALEEGPVPERPKRRRVTPLAPLPPEPHGVSPVLREKVEMHLVSNGYDLLAPK